jgi:hypothetical protein
MFAVEYSLNAFRFKPLSCDLYVIRIIESRNDDQTISDVVHSLSLRS